MKYLILIFLSLNLLNLKPADQTRKSISKENNETQKILSKTYEINQRIKKVSRRISLKQEKILSRKSNVHQLAKDIAQVEINLQKERRSLSKKLVYIYKIQSHYLIALFLSSEKNSSFLNTLKFLKLITLKDKEKLMRYQKSYLSLVDQKNLLYEQMSLLLKNSDELKFLNKKLALEQKALKSLLSKKYNSITRKTLMLNQIDLDQRKLFFEFKGHLPYPAKGEIIQSFGIKNNPTYRYKLFDKGIFLSLKEKTPIRAVFDGKVIYRSYLKSYGNTLIIDHKNHYYSIYSHLNKTLVPKHKKIRKNQIIGLSGHSKLGSGIYFGIRHFSNALNPEKWLKK